MSLFLPQGNYRFALSAFDDQTNVLARGQVEQQVGADSRVSIPLTSLIGSASFRVPESVTANEVFDAFLEVSPPNRPDLRVPLGDFTVSYEVAEPSVQLEGASNVGVRVAAACDVVEVTATVDNELSEEVSASASIPVNDEACDEANETPVGTDLIPPFVSIKAPEADATLNTSFTLQGDVNDQQSGVDRVEVYEGTLKLGDATLNSDAMTWSFDASLEEGSYTLIAVAFDQAGNSSRAEVKVTVEEGAGGGDGGDNSQTCTNPVEIPDEFLEREIREALGKQGGELTCEDLASLVVLEAGPEGDDDRIFSLEGLQFAANLERLSISGTRIETLEPLRNLPKLTTLELDSSGTGTTIDLSALSEVKTLQTLKLTRTNIVSLEPLRGLTDLETLELVDVIIEDTEVSALATLTDLERVVINNIGLDSPILTLDPFINNPGLGDGDTLDLRDSYSSFNCPSDRVRENIETLRGRGVEVLFDEPENCDGDGGNGQETCTNPVNIPDESLRASIRNALELAEDAAITCADLANLTELDYNIEDRFESASLEGLQYAVNLETLSVEPILRDDPEGVLGPALDLSPLSTLAGLSSLELEYVDFTDLTPLQNLTNLTDLSIVVNKEIGDISALQNLSALTSLRLNGVSVSNLSALQNLTNLTELRLFVPVSDISALRNLTNLESLFVLEGSFSNVDALQDLTSLSELNLSFNKIGDISALQNLTSLTDLNLSFNEINDLSALQSLVKLTSLDLSNNMVNDISPLQNLTDLTFLDLGDNSISDISALQNLTALTSLALDSNNVSDVGALQNLTALTSLELGFNEISGISALQNLTNLVSLDLSVNEISDISALQNLTNLSQLDVVNNEVSDLDPLVANEGLGEGDQVFLQVNPLETCPGSDDREDIDTLIERGAEVLFSESDTCQ